MTFSVASDPSCLRGLRFVYTAPGLDGDRVLAQLRTAYRGKLVEGHEQWGEVLVRRAIVQFRFEVQLGARPDELALIHRVSASPAQRATDRAILELALGAT